jgi:hypothetical protein
MDSNMFQLVDPYELQYKQTYKIVANQEYKGRFKGDFYFRDNNEMYLEFDHAYNLTWNVCCEPLFFLSTRAFYRFVSQKARIQWDMERRAVNKIVRRLIGDDCFEW